MIIQSKLPPSFWAEAIATANYIRNRCITKSLDSGTPFEKWTGRCPNVHHLQKFGCKAIILNKSPNKGKFEARGLEGIFVGYSEVSKAYRIWLPKDRKIHLSRRGPSNARPKRPWNRLNFKPLVARSVCSKINGSLTILSLLLDSNRVFVKVGNVVLICNKMRTMIRQNIFTRDVQSFM